MSGGDTPGRPGASERPRAEQDLAIKAVEPRPVGQGTYDTQMPSPRAGARPSKLGRQVAVDFKADTHFDERRSCP